MDETVNLPAAPVDDGYLTAAQDTNASLIVGLNFKFRKGRYPVGRDEGDLLGAHLCGYRVQDAHQKWHDNKPVQVIVRQPGQWFPADVSRIEDDGTPGQWQRTWIVYFRDLQWGHDYTFFTSSFGGSRAVGNLVRQTVNMRYLRPGALPVVRLDAGSFRSAQFGEVQCPTFTVISWVDHEGRPYPTGEQPALLNSGGGQPAEAVRNDNTEDLFQE
jgi:hypothetical protein